MRCFPTLLLSALTALGGLAGAQPVGDGGEVRDLLERTGAVPPAAVPATPAPELELVSSTQDWARLTPDLSCHTLTPLRIGDRLYATGLGAHAAGAAHFALRRPFARFVAEVGIDNNADTGGVRGSAVFAVVGDGAELARTGVCRGGEAPVAVEVDLTGVRALTLAVEDAGDGISYDQADWGDARLVAEDGTSVRLADIVRQSSAYGSPLLRQDRLPASFVYGGRPSPELLGDWECTRLPAESGNGRTAFRSRWTEPGGGLVAELRVELLDGFDAAELTWIFENTGPAPSLELTAVLPLDLDLGALGERTRLLSEAGGLNGAFGQPGLGFGLREGPVTETTLSGAGGRSSARDLPFLAIHDAPSSSGLAIGVGWSGQWQASVARGEAPSSYDLSIGMPGTRISLAPGERITTPRVLVASYGGTRAEGGNLMRRIIRARYAPALAGAPTVPPVSWSSWFVLGNGISEELLRREADVAAGLGIEYFCIDAGWFDGDFPDGVGNWTVNTDKFPRGLGPIGEHVRARGMQLGLWFEPERAAPGTRLVREHPEWVHNDLVDLGRPEAREWIFEMMSRHIREGGVRWIRFDCNIDPLGAWDAMDGPDRRGIAQIRHIEGLYELLDRLMAEFPDLLIEGCASGGLRIDLGTIRRAHTFWKSDQTALLPVLRFHETAANTFLPGGLLNVNLLQVGSAFDLRSLFAGPLGFGCVWSTLSEEQRALVRDEIAIYRQLRRLLDADYTPLFAASQGEEGWCGWQFHDPVRGEGCVVALRPRGSAYSRADLRLCGLEAEGRYRLRELGGAGGEPQLHTGAELGEGWSVELDAPESGRVFLYERVTP